jgi:hypothetical protein
MISNCGRSHSMEENLPEEFNSLTYKQIRFLQLFVGSKEKEPDVLKCLEDAGYNTDNRTASLKVGRKILGRFSNNNNLNFQRLLSIVLTDLDITKKLSNMLYCGDPRTEMTALKLITELKGYNEKQFEHKGSSIVIEIMDNTDSSDNEAKQLTEIRTNVLPLKSTT